MNHLIKEIRNGYLVVTMNRGTANALEQTLVDELRKIFKEAASDDQVRGIVLAGRDRFFSAGLDLIELYEYDAPQIEHFWRSFMLLIQEMTAWPKPLVAAVTGHAPAGGCLLAITADYRVMAAGDFGIGLNEVPVGIIVPEAIFNLYRFWIGDNAAHTMLLEGKVVKPDKALEIGLIHEVAEAGEVVERAEKQLQRYLGFHPTTWQTSKANLRRRLCAEMSFDFDEVFAPALNLWWEPSTRAIVKMMVEGLKARSKK